MQMDQIIGEAAVLETFHGGSVATIGTELYQAFGSDLENRFGQARRQFLGPGETGRD